MKRDEDPAAQTVLRKIVLHELGRLRFRIWGLGFRVKGSRGLRFRIWGFPKIRGYIGFRV